MRIPAFLGNLAVAAMLAGCAVGQKHEFGTATPDLQVQGKGEVAVGVVDRRPYVESGDKEATFVGLQRGGYGNPFDVHTVSGQPVSSDLAEVIVNALTRSGFQAHAVETEPGEGEPGLLRKLASTGRAMLLTISELKSDTYNNTAFHYDMELKTLDDQGRTIAASSVSGRDNLGGSIVNPSGHAKSAVPPAVEGKLESLLNDPKITSALQQTAAVETH